MPVACRVGRWRMSGIGMSVVAAALAVGASAVAQSAATVDAAVLGPKLAAAREATHRHAEELRVNLFQALKAGGAKAAVGACTSIAPEIDGKITESSGFEIGRTALKIRNPENAPDAWEKAQLEQFVKKLGAGADYKALEAYDVSTTAEGQKLFRYMRPIMMREPCLACHGPSVAQDIKAEIARTYNDDKAVGFNLGELRGAFTLVQVIE